MFELFEDSKYDIMIREENMQTIGLFKMTGKLLDLTTRLEMSELSEEDFKIELSKLVLESLEASKFLAHLGYENGKDLNGIDVKSVTEYIRSNGFNINRFSVSYCHQIEKYAKLLLIFMIIDEEKIDVSSLDNIEYCNKIMDGDIKGLVPFITKPLDDMSLDNLDLIQIMQRDDFSVSLLNQRQIDRLNKYHDDFMKKEIYPKVTKDVVENDRVLKQAKRIGKMRRFN